MKRVSLTRQVAFFCTLSTSVALTGCSQELTLNLSVGECALLPGNSYIASVTTTDCSSVHHAEVVGTLAITSAELPTQADLERHAEEGCTPHFEKYVGTTLEKSALELQWLLPTEASWKAGDRTIVCLAIAPNEQSLTTSLKGSGL